jgi:signal transduction histidine kinase
VALALGGGAYGLHAVRVRRLIGLERIRRQIATDLHDDVGSGLVQIAVMSEVAKRHAGLEAGGVLDEVAELARALRDSMSDIVWSVDPRRDRLSDLVRRLRQVTFGLFEAGKVDVSFDAPADEVLGRIELSPDRRRHLFLAAKEALTNAAKHAAAKRVGVDVQIARSRLRLQVVDDGCGFDVTAPTDGQGVASLRRRAEALGGRLEVKSAPGRGTTLRLDVPLRGHVD